MYDSPVFIRGKPHTGTDMHNNFIMLEIACQSAQNVKSCFFVHLGSFFLQKLEIFYTVRVDKRAFIYYNSVIRSARPPVRRPYAAQTDEKEEEYAVRTFWQARL